MHTSDFQLQGFALWADISHPPALLPFLQHSKQLQPATLSFVLPFKPFYKRFQQDIGFLWLVLHPFAVQGMAVFCHQSL